MVANLRTFAELAGALSAVAALLSWLFVSAFYSPLGLAPGDAGVDLEWMVIRGATIGLSIIVVAIIPALAFSWPDSIYFTRRLRLWIAYLIVSITSSTVFAQFTGGITWDVVIQGFAAAGVLFAVVLVATRRFATNSAEYVSYSAQAMCLVALIILGGSAANYGRSLSYQVLQGQPVSVGVSDLVTLFSVDAYRVSSLTGGSNLSFCGLEIGNSAGQLTFFTKEGAFLSVPTSSVFLVKEPAAC